MSDAIQPRLTFQMINRHAPVPPAAQRVRKWVRVGKQLRFTSGLCMRVDFHQAVGGMDLRLHWHFGDSAMAAITCYEPVSLVSDCGQRVVIRAVAMLHGTPLAVLAEIEGVDCEPQACVERAA